MAFLAFPQLVDVYNFCECFCRGPPPTNCFYTNGDSFFFTNHLHWLSARSPYNLVFNLHIRWLNPCWKIETFPCLSNLAILWHLYLDWIAFVCGQITERMHWTFQSLPVTIKLTFESEINFERRRIQRFSAFGIF